MIYSKRGSIRGFVAGLAFVSLLAASGCGKGGKIAAVVNGDVITVQELDQRMASLNPSLRAALGNDSKRLLEEIVMETLLVQEARRRNLDRDAEVNKLFKEAKKQILLGRLLEVIRQRGPQEASDKEVEQFYKANEDRFMEPESQRASHVLVGTQEEAQKALDRIKKGESFEKVAQEVSVDPTKAKGGDIGYFSKGQLIPEFEAACEKLAVGQTSEIVKSQLGYHIIKLTDKKPARKRALDEVKDFIRRQLASQRQQQEVEAFIQGLRAKAQVQIREPYVAAAVPPPQTNSSSAPGQAPASKSSP